MFPIRRATSSAAPLAALCVAMTAASPAAASPVGHQRGFVNAAQAHATSAYTVLHSFGISDGAAPQGALDLALQLNGFSITRTIYGTTTSGGATGDGTIYTYGIDSGALTAPLHSFAGGTEGGAPQGGLINNATDYFPGGSAQLSVAALGGSMGFGTVFAAAANGSVMTLYTFSGGADGGNPAGRLVQFTDGKYYGTTSTAGAFGYGTIFSITTSGQFTTLYSFTGLADGGSPAAGLSLRYNLNGHANSLSIQGRDPRSTIERMRANWKKQYISPYLYGTTTGAGTAGTIFRFNPANRALATLYTFTGGADGSTPQAELSPDLNGNLYGTASAGGDAGGDGAVFVLPQSNKLVVLHDFNYADGSAPVAPITVAFNGALYGTTSNGGAGGNGDVFKLSGSAFTDMHDFSGADGANPNGKLLDGLDGNLYGTTQNGGANSSGVLFTLPQ